MATIKNLSTLLSSSAKIAKEIVETAAANKQKINQELTDVIKKDVDDFFGDYFVSTAQKAERLNAIKTKIGKYLKIFGSTGEMKKESLIDIGNGRQVSFKINGKHRAGRQVVLKEADETLELFLDEKGIVKSGDLSANAWGRRLTFSRNERNVRRFNYHGVDYAPVGNADNMWRPVAATSEHYSGGFEELSSNFRYSSSPLLDLLLDLANKTSRV